jgi:hypothetical protein
LGQFSLFIHAITEFFRGRAQVDHACAARSAIEAAEAIGR